MDRVLGINPYDTDALHLKASVYMVAKDKNKVTKYCMRFYRGARELDRLNTVAVFYNWWGVLLDRPPSER